MTGDIRVRNAAILAQRWSMDIVDVLAEDDELRACLRIAGHTVLNRLEERARSG